MNKSDDCPVAVKFTFDKLETVVIIAESTFQASIFMQDQCLFSKDCHIITPEIFQNPQIHSINMFWVMMIVRAYVEKKIGIRPVKHIARLINDLAISAELGNAHVQEIYPQA